ncbi:putative 40S ribosomal protein S15 [Hypsibius exemplaris]|uniref:40S ribosomal protein S15 n=1 Tax=Hypsibius exemplaris TaxID=2072580 RepID=A0A1W0WVB2_HYPEX|nr:putative 40S ribosomal protein S15 [Hypsibius exemplaris]
MADQIDAEELKKKRQFRKFAYRGVDLEQLLTLNLQEVTKLLPCRARRVIRRGAKHKKSALMKKLRNAKKNAPVNEKPEVVKTHLRNAIILPEMIGCVVGIHNGKVYNQVEIKPEMIGHYLGEFSMTYKPVKHGRPVLWAFRLAGSSEDSLNLDWK